MVIEGWWVWRASDGCEWVLMGVKRVLEKTWRA